MNYSIIFEYGIVLKNYNGTEYIIPDLNGHTDGRIKERTDGHTAE